MKKEMMTRVLLGVALACCLVPAMAFAEPNVNVTVTGYLPAPPGVHVYVEGGRPYYIERDRRVYIEREPQHRKHHHDRGRHRGWEKRHESHGKHGRH